MREGQQAEQPGRQSGIGAILPVDNGAILSEFHPNTNGIPTPRGCRRTTVQGAFRDTALRGTGGVCAA